MTKMSQIQKQVNKRAKVKKVNVKNIKTKNFESCQMTKWPKTKCRMRKIMNVENQISEI